MNIARLAIKRPILIGCIVILMVVTGIIGFNRLGVDLFPPIDFPVVTVTTIYPGATPEEIENLITKPLEEQVSTIAGIKRLSSRNLEGLSIVIAEFTYETQVRYAEEKVREKVSIARGELPDDLEQEPLIRQFDFTDMPVLTLAVTGDLPPTEMYDLVKERIKPVIEQVSGVGEVRISGGRRREIQVELDMNKLNAYEISAITVANQLKNTGANIPVGKYDRGQTSTLFRSIGEFTNIEQIKKSVIGFENDVSNAVTLDKLGVVRDDAEEVKTISYLYYPVEEAAEQPGFFQRVFGGAKAKEMKFEQKPALVIDIFKQSGTNSVAVTDGVLKRIDKINAIIKAAKGNPRLVFVYDTAKYIRRNVDDVKETMIIGIILAVVVVYLFLGNLRSTIITGVAIPNSLLGAFVIMYFMDFTVNIMTLLALSLTVGLLVDDAIVVRENIFRKLESGMHPMKAAEHGTKEVMLAVIATTLTVIAVFLPIGFLQGIVGRFFKQFGLTVVFAMSISLFDALTVAPLLSAYFAGKGGKAKNIVVRKFDELQDRTDKLYSRLLNFSVTHPMKIVGITTLVFFLSIGAFFVIGKTFQADPDEGEFLVNMEMPPGTSIYGTQDLAQKIAEKIKTIPELHHMNIQVGNDQGEYNLASIGVFMVPRKERNRTTNELKEEVRGFLKDPRFAVANPSLDNYTRSAGGAGNKPYILNLAGDDLEALHKYSLKVMEKLKDVPDLTEITSSFQTGKPEFQVQLNEQRMQMLGVSHKTAGAELRYRVEGGVVGKFKDKSQDLEYDIRMRLQPDQRDLQRVFAETRIPNMKQKIIPLSAISTGVNTTGPAKILRQDRSRIIQIFANIAPGGADGNAIGKTRQILEKDLGLPQGVSYGFVGRADAFEDMIKNISVAFMLSLLFIYLVLASLYESFITPVTILLALPPAMSGAFLALFLTGRLMDMNCMIGVVMLLGLVTKNSILLVDFALEGVRAGLSRKEAIIKAGMIRLRPILMTTFAMLAGTLPVALGVGEAAKYRVSMGVAIIGGLVVSTLITLLVVPAVFEYIDELREKIESAFRPEPEKLAVNNFNGEDAISREIVSDLKKFERKHGAAAFVDEDSPIPVTTAVKRPAPKRKK